MNQDIREISSITFGVLSTEQILNMSVCKIDNTKLGGIDKTGNIGTVYDGRMGTIENGKDCETCHQDVWTCPGHFGHIEFNEPIIHPLFYKQVTSYLKCFCIKCFRLLLNRDQIYLNDLNRFKGNKRFEKIIEKLEKIDTCSYCSHPQPEFKYSPIDNTISMVCKQKGYDKLVIVLTVEEIKKTFNNIINEDIELLGFDPVMVHPKNYIMSVFPVLPQTCRPFVIADGNTCDDDLSNQIVEIIKANNHLAEDDNTLKSDTKRQKYLQSLKFRVSTFYNNSAGKAKHTTSGRPIRGLKERLTGKDGQIRTNLMGKRSCTPNTPILMFSGKIKKAENIVVGDIVVGDDGSPRTVVNTVTGESLLYKVKQSYGEDYGISCEHILTLKYCEHCKIHWVNKNKNGKWVMKWYDRENNIIKTKKIPVIPGITIEEAKQQMEYFKSTLNTNPIIDIHVKYYLSLSNDVRKCMFGIKLSKPIQWVYKEVKLNPRILGMWLGNNTANESMNFILNDEELVKYLTTWAEENNVTIKKYDKFCYTIVGSSNAFTIPIEYYGLNNSKYIPEEYIINDENTRLLLLAGLIDTENTIEHKNNTICISQLLEHKAILDGAEKIARSLGFRTDISCINTSFNSNDELENKKILILTISGKGIEQIPTLNPRKNCNSSNYDTSCYKIEVVEDGIGRFCGFEVDKNNRFILGDFTITHNCDQTGRTVIGPDPTLKMGQLAVPVEMADILTVPVHITNFNIDMMTKLVNEGKANFVLKKGGTTRINLQNALFYRGTRLMHGDIIVRGKEEIVVNCGNTQLKSGDRLKRNGLFVEDLKYPGKRKYILEIGDIVERKLKDGDIVLLNRQPTLHKASMMAQEVVIRPFKTLRMNLSICKPFNADFDGDEMNIHVAQSLESQIELRELSASKHNLISAQDGKPNMAIVQDSLLGAYRMTVGIQKVRKDQFFNISLKLDITVEQTMMKIQHISRIMKKKGKSSDPYHGKGLISLILPDDLIYEKKNNTDPNEPVLKIYRGVLYEGAINKTIVGASHNSLIQIMYKEYGADAAAKFIDGIQFITNNWLLISGFSVGVEDCLIQGKNKEEEIKDEIQKCFIEAEGIKTTTSHPIIRELRISAVLNKAKDIGLRIAKDALDQNNNFLSTVNSGSKGDFFNIAQITGLLGQQNLKGQRVVYSLNHGKRSLPHYPFGELPVDIEYESRGFIASSFIKGLNPKQFYFHAMSGREGICDTAMGTATSGYMQRRIVKLTEDIKTQYDGTVRDSIGKTYQLSYGGDGLDPVNTVKVNGSHEVCDVSRIVARLNMNHELCLNPDEEELTDDE